MAEFPEVKWDRIVQSGELQHHLHHVESILLNEAEQQLLDLDSRSGDGP
jgi:hypothetical protein